MRFHSRGRACWLNHDPEAARRLMLPSQLAIARLEPAMSARYEATLDLIFERDGEFAVLPFVIVDGLFTVEREMSPFAWPQAVREIFDVSALAELERAIEPWLEALLLARSENEIVTKFVRDEPPIRAAFEKAAALGLMGAAPSAAVLQNAAPYVYAYRFTDGANVDIIAAGGSNGAALLFGRARSVSLRDGGDASAFARAWFGTQRWLDAANDPADVVICDEEPPHGAPVVIRLHSRSATERTVSVARSLPLTTFVSFDPDDSIEEDAFTVRAHAANPPAQSRLNAEPAAVGGSGGRVALLVREDWSRSQDADSDAIRVLERRLSGEGFAVRIVEGWSHIEAEDVDLVHVIGTQHAGIIRPKLERLKAAGIPIVAMPYLDDPRGEGAWGAALSLFAFRNSSEDATLDMYLDAFAKRRLSVDGVPLHHELPPAPDPDVARLFELSGAVIVSTPEEETLIRQRFGYAGPTPLVPAIVSPAPPADVTAIAGTGGFILMHGPLDARSNVLAAAIAAEAEGLPLIVTGQVAAGDVMTFLCTYGGDFVRYVPAAQLRPEDVEGLYARARVFADLSWNGRGLSRLARAGGYGVPLVATGASHAGGIWGDLLTRADAADIASIREAFRAAWNESPQRRRAIAAVTAEICNPVLALSGTVLAYQLAAQSQPAPADAR